MTICRPTMESCATTTAGCRLAEAIDWDRFEQGYSELFAPSGKAAIPARIALGCRVIQLHYEVSDREVVAAGAGKPLPAIFFGHGNFQR